MRAYELPPRSEAADDGERRGTLKGMFKKGKRSKHLELDALRCGLMM
jgi:hypothetical protein